MSHVLIDHKGVKIVSPEPTGLGGQTLNENFRLLAGKYPVFTYQVLWSAAMPVDVMDVPDSRTIREISVNAFQAFTAPGAYVNIGTPADPTRFFNSGDSDLYEVGVDFSKLINVAGPVTVRLTLNPGIAPTSGGIFVVVTTTPAP